MNKRWLKLAVVPVALSLVAAACGSDDDSSGSDTSDAVTEATDGGDGGETTDFEGAEVTITGSERDDPSVIAINDALNEHFGPMNLTVTYAGDADWEANINTQVQGGNPPDIGFFPQPGKLADFARQDFIVPLDDAVNAAIAEYWAPGLSDVVKVDGVQYGVPVKSDLKGIVFYKPARFEADGYEVPKTYDEFIALVDEMAAAGGSKPLCVGIESGTATGWMFTDWVEDMMLRLHGGDVYDQWVSNEVTFDDPRRSSRPCRPSRTCGPTRTCSPPVARSRRRTSVLRLPRLTPMTTATWSATRTSSPVCTRPGTTFADPENPEAIDVFYFPDINGDRPVLSAGNFAAAFNDDPATMAVLEYMATADYAREPSADPVGRSSMAASQAISRLPRGRTRASTSRSSRASSRSSRAPTSCGSTVAT